MAETSETDTSVVPLARSRDWGTRRSSRPAARRGRSKFCTRFGTTAKIRAILGPDVEIMTDVQLMAEGGIETIINEARVLAGLPPVPLART
jgi:hypothetical protein